MTNPYAPPTTEAIEPSSVKLYSAGQVAWASFLGAPIAGCVLLAINYRRFGNFTAARTSLVMGVIGTCLLLIISFFVPDRIPRILPVAYTFAMYQCAKSRQKNDYERRLANGAIKASTWAATGIGILSLIGIFVALIAFLLVLPEEWFGEEF